MTLYETIGNALDVTGVFPTQISFLKIGCQGLSTLNLLCRQRLRQTLTCSAGECPGRDMAVDAARLFRARNSECSGV